MWFFLERRLKWHFWPSLKRNKTACGKELLVPTGSAGPAPGFSPEDGLLCRICVKYYEKRYEW